MATRKETTQVTQASSAAASGDFMAMFAAAMEQGKDPSALLQEAQVEKRRQTAIKNHGVMNVQLNRAMPIKHSTTTGRYYALGSLIATGTEGVKVQGGRALTADRLAKLGRIEIDLGLSEDCASMVQQHRNDVGGNHVFEFVLEGESQLTKLNARYPNNHEEFPKQNIYLTDPEGDKTDPRNWTAEETATPLMKWQIKLMAVGYLSTSTAQIPGEDLPESEEDFDSMLEEAGKVSSVLSARGLADWQKGRQQEREANPTTNPVVDLTSSD